MVTLSHLIHSFTHCHKANQKFADTSSRNKWTEAGFYSRHPFPFHPSPLSLFPSLTLPSAPATQARRYEIHIHHFIELLSYHCFKAMLLVQILTCQGINREQMIKRTYVTLFISFPLLSILGVFHRSRVLCPPFLSRWFLNITIYLEKFKTKNNFCECQNNLYVKKLPGRFCLKTFI